jgi:hypothetical protein
LSGLPLWLFGMESETASTSTTGILAVALEGPSFGYRFQEHVSHFQVAGLVQFMVVEDLSRQATTIEGFGEGVLVHRVLTGSMLTLTHETAVV